MSNGELLSVRQAADKLGRAISTVTYLCRIGALPCKKIGVGKNGRWVIFESELERYQSRGRGRTARWTNLAHFFKEAHPERLGEVFDPERECPECGGHYLIGRDDVNPYPDDNDRRAKPVTEDEWRQFIGPNGQPWMICVNCNHAGTVGEFDPGSEQAAEARANADEPVPA